MRRRLAVILLYGCVLIGGAPAFLEAQTTPNVALGLSLPAPQKVKAGEGWVEITATCAQPVTFDVEAQLDDPKATFKSRVIDDKTVLVSVPCCGGIIRVTAVAIVGGKLTPFVRTYVEIEGREPPAPPTPPAPPAPPKQRPAGKLSLVLVIDQQGGDPTSAALAASPTLRKAVNDAGASLHVFDARSAVIAQQNLTKYVADASGAPALIILDSTGTVWAAKHLPATEAEVIQTLKGVGQ